MSELHFAEPAWIHALWGVVALAILLLALERRGHAAIERIVSPRMRDRLVAAPSAIRRRLAIVLLALCAACLVVGMMQPQWGFRRVTTPRVGAKIMIALDVSRSMLAEDVAPSRLDRAKAEIADLLGLLDGDQVGLIAFAGRATVVSPLTPDFSFLRMVLDSVGPDSVSRGGTRLAEPIRKATAGFGPAGDASRAILLITDGEDHDSFALDAARKAAKAGIVIITIGLGGKAGSEIPVTDPRTGARTLLRDADGKPVRSHLDGDLLRKIALATGGAYVPAGTGVLDLPSIYEHYIARLTRGHLDARSRTVRGEHYQWPVLLGFVLLVSSVVVAAGPLFRVAALVLLLVPLSSAHAGASVVSPTPAATGSAAKLAPGPGAAGQTNAPAAQGGSGKSAEAGGAQPEQKPEDPRALYNQGVAAIDRKDFEQAEKLLERARSQAGADGELRFRASYNLGLATVKGALAIEAEKPQEALAGLDRGAAWFREAVQQRPDHEDARRNLEVTLRRALLLEDRLAREHASDLEKQLAELASRQRGIAAGVALLLEKSAAETAADPNAVDRYRHEFADQATGQRTLLSDTDALADRTADEWQALQSRPKEKRKPGDDMRAAQLGAVLEHLHGARERMGQTRVLLRRRQAERAYRRAAAALQELERARDPLRDPASLLDALIRDESQVADATGLLAGAGRQLAGGKAPPAAPPWVSRDTLRDSQKSVLDRTTELDARLRAGLASPPSGATSQAGGNASAAAGGNASAAAGGNASAAASAAASAQLARAREAEPFVGDAQKQLESASRHLEVGALDDVHEAQRQGIAALREARERFLGLKGLIEAAYATEKRIQGVLHEQVQAKASVKDEYLDSLRTAQQGNRERAHRIGERLDDAAQVPGAPGSGAGAAGTTQDAQGAAGTSQDAQGAAGTTQNAQAQAQAQRLAKAHEALDGAVSAMRDVEHALGQRASGWHAASSGADQAVDRLEALRRLFFSVIDRVRELADGQTELADATRDAAALQQASRPDRRSQALAPRQQALASRSGQVARELAAQSDDAAAHKDSPDAVDAGHRLRLAGERVLAAQDAMDAAATSLGGAPPKPAEAQGHQGEALKQLHAALDLLTPPDQQKQQQKQQKKKNQQAQNQQQSGKGPSQQAGRKQDEQKAEQAMADPAQLLQAVRDREAQRRRQRAHARARYAPVEKDW